MTQHIDISVTKFMRAIFLTSLLALSGFLRAAPIDGTWHHVKSMEYFGNAAIIVPLLKTTINVSNGKLIITPKCSVSLVSEAYDSSSVFQMLMRRRVSQNDVARFLEREAGFHLDKVETTYRPNGGDCAEGFSELLVEGNKMVVVHRNSAFYIFQRTPAPKKTTIGLSAEIKRKNSPLPFSIPDFGRLCQSKIPVVKGVPQSTNKCAPLFYPYVASRDSVDEIGKLVGTHRYTSRDADSDGSFSNPVSHGLHPLFMVLPPLKEVQLIRVDDLEWSESRNAFHGAYLAIKNGRVIDQLNEGCSFTVEYVCVDRDGTKLYRLLESGRFAEY